LIQTGEKIIQRGEGAKNRPPDAESEEGASGEKKKRAWWGEGESQNKREKRDDIFQKYITGDQKLREGITL